MSDQINAAEDYVRGVARHLKARGPRRRQAITVLRDALTEAAVTTTDEAVAVFGSAADYAAGLDAEFGTAGGAFRTILGVPNSFGPGIGKRLAGTFEPTDERLLVPRVFGGGWTLNVGALAVRLGLLRPDDLDDDVAAAAVDRHLLPAQLAAVVPVVATGALAVRLWPRRDTLIADTGKTGSADLVATGLVAGVLGAVLLASSSDAVEPRQRLAMPGAAAALGVLLLGKTAQTAVRPGGQLWTVVGAAAAVPVWLALTVGPVRTALRDRWEASPQ